MPVQDILIEMQNKSFMYNTIVHKIINFKIIGQTLHLITNKKWIEMPVDNAEKLLRDNFLPAEEEKITESKLPVIFDKIQSADLPGILLANINKLQADPSYVNQAKQINGSVNSLISMVKVSLDAERMKNK